MLGKLRSGLRELLHSTGYRDEVAGGLTVAAIGALLGALWWWLTTADNGAWLAETIWAPVVVQLSSPVSAPWWALLAFGLLSASAIVALLVLIRRLHDAAGRLREDNDALTEKNKRQLSEITSARDEVKRLTQQRDDIARHMLPRGTKIDDARLRELIENPPETVGGWVEVGPCAFSVDRVPYSNAPDRFEADGPFCAGCKIRLNVAGSHGVNTYTCISSECRLARNSLNSKEVKPLEKHAESMVEAAFKAVRREGRRATVNPHIPLMAPGPPAAGASGEDAADAV